MYRTTQQDTREDESGYLMQHTGSKDKNGKDVYDGDMINTKRWGTSVVVYLEGLGKFAGNSEYVDDGSYLFDLTEPLELEVIGNIYENPELLESK